MRIRAILLSFVAGLSLVILFLVGPGQAQARLIGATDPVVYAEPEEAPLNPTGSAYEINIGPEGQLWISDFGADEIWQVNPTTGVYTSFHGLQAPTDARRDPAGNVWWGDGLEGRFGRLDPASGEATWWAIQGADALLGSQIDVDGDLWIAAWDDPFLYNFDPQAGQLRTYTLPLAGIISYPQYDDGSLWLGDEYNGVLLRLFPKFAQYMTWSLPIDSTPLGMALDEAGDLWYADPNNAQLARFRPNAGQLDIYDPPTGLLPSMMASRGNNIWYSERWDGAIGRLDPAVASSSTITLTTGISPAEINCAPVTPVLTRTVTMVQGSMDWVTQTYPLLADSDGWRVHELPSGALPWGVATGPDAVTFVDTGRQMLGRIPLDASVDITACKEEDDDGRLDTNDDRSPVSGWSMQLFMDGLPLTPTKQTGPDGCVSWPDLEPGAAYSLTEDTPAGWTALLPTSHEIPQIVPGQGYTHTFINSQLMDQKYLYLPIVQR